MRFKCKAFKDVRVNCFLRILTANAMSCHIIHRAHALKELSKHIWGWAVALTLLAIFSLKCSVTPYFSSRPLSLPLSQRLWKSEPNINVGSSKICNFSDHAASNFGICVAVKREQMRSRNDNICSENVVSTFNFVYGSTCTIIMQIKF